MSMTIRIDESVYDKAVLDNPDLPIDFVRDILISHAKDKSLAEPFIPEN